MPGKARSGKLGLLLDRHVGRTVLTALGIVRRRRPIPVNPAHVGFSVLGAIGDTLVASAIMADARRAWPNARITLVASDTNRAIAVLLPVIDAVITIPVNRPDRAARLIREAKFDLFIDCNQWIRISAIHAALAGCFSVGFRTDAQHRHFAYDLVVPHGRDRHEIENYRGLLAPLGIATTALPAVAFDAEVPAAFRAPPGSAGTVIFHPWAGGAKGVLKEWPDDYWVELGVALQVRGHHLIVTGGPGDVARSEALVQAARAAGVALLSSAGKVSLPQLAALLDSAAAVVSVNTGIMHLAAAVDAPLVALNGPVRADRWGPLNEDAISLAPENGGGYLYLGFEHPPSAPNCMMAISPSLAAASVTQVIDMRQKRRQRAAS